MSELGGEQSGAIVAAFQRFRLHAIDCETHCNRAARVVVRGGSVDIGELHWLCCDIGRPLLEEWHHACQERMETIRENLGIRRLPA